MNSHKNKFSKLVRKRKLKSLGKQPSHSNSKSLLKPKSLTHRDLKSRSSVQHKDFKISQFMRNKKMKTSMSEPKHFEKLNTLTRDQYASMISMKYQTVSFAL